MAGKDYVLPGAIVLGSLVFVFRDRLFGKFTAGGNEGVKAVQAAPTGGAPVATTSFLNVTAAPLFRAGTKGVQVPAAAGVNAPPPPGNQAGGPIGGIGAKDIVQGAAAAAAAAGCTSLGGVGAIAAPLCASAGAALGGAAYSGAQSAGRAIGNAAGSVGSWVKGLF